MDETKTIITNKKTIVHHTLLEEVPTSDENIVEVKYLNSKKLWPKRTQVEEENLLYDFLKVFYLIFLAFFSKKVKLLKNYLIFIIFLFFLI